MNPIQELAERIASGAVIDGVESCILVMRDFAAGCDWTGVAGSAEPTTEASPTAAEPFPAADMTHVLTSAAVLRACDLSLLGLDKSVANYLPADLVDRLHVSDGESRGGDITVRQLLDHTPIAQGNDGGDARTGFVLAGMILEDVTGMKLHDVHREFVLDRVGMDSTSLDRNDDALVTAADLATLMIGVGDGDLLTVDSWDEMTDWADDPTGDYDEYGLGLGRYRLGDLDAVGYHGASGAFAFRLPFDVVIAGTVNAENVDHRPLVKAVLEALC